MTSRHELIERAHDGTVSLLQEAIERMDISLEQHREAGHLDDEMEAKGIDGDRGHIANVGTALDSVLNVAASRFGNKVALWGLVSCIERRGMKVGYLVKEKP